MQRVSDSSFEERWRRRFERYALSSDDDAGIAGWSAGGLAARFRRFRALWQAHPAPARDSPWLDAGCGAGTYSRFLCEQGLQVTGVDYSLPTAQRARERSSPAIHWAVADVNRLPFPDRSFDGVLCFGVLQALGSARGALVELHRVLRPGGALWVDALNARCLPSALAERRRQRAGHPPHLRYDAPAELRGGLADAGFGAVELFWVPIAPSRLAALQPLVESRPLRGLLSAVPPLGERLSHSIVARAVRR